MRDSFVSNELLATIREQFQLNWNGTHGIAHFMRVRENGLALCAKNGARPHIVELFAFLHDSRRLNENADPDHGKRAAEFAFSLRKSLLNLDDSELSLLITACEFHTSGFPCSDITILTCWDSDRLDLGRVGIMPAPSRLCTEAAKSPGMIKWAYERSIRDGIG
jgi:uncharacterized protein